MAKKNLYINNTSLGTYGIYISSDTVLNAPSFDYVEHQVPGRDGTLLQYNNRLNNVIRKFTCYAPLNTTPATAIANVKSLIYSTPGYVKISSDYETDTYQYGYLAQDIQVKPFNRYKTAEFDLYFSCLPKKLFNTNSQIYGVVSNQDYNILSRSSDIVQNVLNDIPPSFVPSDTMYYFINYSESFSTLANVTLSWSGGGTFMALVGEVNGLLAYSNANISESSITVLNAETKLSILIGVKTSGTLTLQYTNSGTTKTKTFDCATEVVTTNKSGASGVDLTELHITYSKAVHGVGTFAPNSLYISSYLNGVFQSDAAVILRNDLYPASMASKLTDYSGGFGYEIIVNLNTGEAKMVKSGLPDLPMDSYFEIYGSISYADQVKTLGHGMSVYSGKPVWWVL